MDPREVLTPADYDRAWRVIEDCSAARSLPEFREILMESLARYEIAPLLEAVQRNYADGAASRGRNALPRGPVSERDQEYGAAGRGRDAKPRRPSGERDQQYGAVGRGRGGGGEGQRDAMPRGPVSERDQGRDQGHGHEQGQEHGHEDGQVRDLEHGPRRSWPPKAYQARDIALYGLMSPVISNMMDRCAAAAPEPSWLAALGPRQAEAARLLAEGLSNEDIARRMHVGVPTVKKYVTTILRASGCRSRAEVAARWTRWRWTR
ncbi:helix-turn-helix transcriptional regulator [Streptosporangiaceae bacterium NEAU-GS5]|nr:helix-turn-helix transcriptional regulator [Streptosporangiaceae bacterium NEAU-GS5]